MIGITLVQAKKELDLYVPIKVTLGRFKELIHALFKEHDVLLPENFQLVIQNKVIQIGETDILADFGIANGDKIEIILGE